MRLAKAHMEKKEYDQARAQFDNALQINMTNHEAYYFLGLIQESRQQFRTAQEYYSRALEYYPEYLPAKTKLARIQIMFGQTAQAADQAKAVLKADPENMPAKALLAEVGATQNSLSKAIEDLERSRKKGPPSLEVYAQLVNLYLRQNNLAQAESVLSQALKQYPQDMKLQTYSAQVYQAGDKPARAEIPLKTIIALEPSEFSHQAKLASHYVLVGNPEKAEATLRNSVAAMPQDVKRVLALTEFLLRHRTPEAAEAELQSFIQASPQSYELRFALAELYEATGLQGKAERIYLDLLAQKRSSGENEKAHTHLARMYAGMGKVSSAKTHVSEALQLSKNSPDALATRGKIALEEGDLERAIADFRSAVRTQPDSMEYIGLLARAHTQNKEPALAKEMLMQAVKNNRNNLPMRAMLAQHLFDLRDYKNALEAVDDAIKNSPFDQALQDFRLRILGAQKASPSANGSFSVAENTLPANVAAKYRQGAQFLDQKKYDEAIAEFARAHRANPAAIEPLQGLVQAYLAQGRPDLALATVKAQLRITSPTLHQAYFLLAQIYEKQNQSAEAIRAYQRVFDIKATWDAPYLALAQHYYARKENQKGLAILDTALRVMPNNQIVALHLAGMLEANQNFERAIAEYEKILQQDANLEVAMNNLSILLLDKRGDKASVERALKLARRFDNSHNAAYLDTLGWALFKSGQASRGLPYLEKALAAEPDMPSYHYHIGLAYKAAGEKDKAKTHLLKSIATGERFSGHDQAKAAAATL